MRAKPVLKIPNTVKMKVDLLKYDFPYSCYINLTSKCNLRCKHCFGSYGSPKSELTLDQWKKVIDDLYSLKLFFVNISGGEPTQSPYFKEFIQYLTKRGMHFILTTNGIFSKEIRDFIIHNKEYLIGVKISLDGPDKESYGFIRRDCYGRYNPHLFKIVMGNILFFKKNKIPLTIASVLHAGNINKIGKLINLVRKIDPVSWFISPIVPVGRGEENKNISKFYELFDASFWENLRKKSKKRRINTRLIDLPVNMGKEGLSAYSCAGAINFCEIHADGTVSPCSLARVCIPEDKIKFDNIKDKSLRDIWEGEPFKKFRGFMNVGCDGCKMLSKCNKCVAQSFKYFGDGNSPTPFCIKNGKELKLKGYEKYRNILIKQFNLQV